MSGDHWRPLAGPGVLRQRAQALAAARAFFAARGLLEVETPALVSHAVSDPQLANIRVSLGGPAARELFLHTSPEYHMKRLLAAGAPDIWQIGKVFRDGESGARHLPEFTLVEWYRRSVDYAGFIAEAADFVRSVAAALGRTLPAPVMDSYAGLLQEFAGIDALEAPVAAIRVRAQALLGVQLDAGLAQGLGDDRDAWLDLLVVAVVEPALRGRGLVVVDRFPASQAALARLVPDDVRVARRFEIYLDGIELANGYHELGDVAEQRRRFTLDRERRRQLGRPDTAPDEALLAALAVGLPDCCGVAVGFDRLLMAGLGLDSIRQVVAFAPGPDQD